MLPIDKYVQGQVLLLDKPLHWTSFDVVKKVRILTKVSKVGHAGTLDPLATGLLIICTGKFTKSINEYMGMLKEYEGTFTIGATTPSYDLETTPINQKPFNHITPEIIQKTAASFLGDILQMPPMHSAIKKDGKPLYLSARKGIEVEINPRPVHIYSFEIAQIVLPIVHFKVICSTGTYIRSLAYDFGVALQTGAYLSSLRRTKIGEFDVQNASSVEAFTKIIEEIRSPEEA